MTERGGPISGRSGDPEGNTHSRAVEVAAAMYRTYRTVRFYPALHPTAEEELGHFHDILARATDEAGELSLDVREKTLVAGAVTVFSEDETRDNLAHTMYLDGIRSIVFRPGVEASEVEAFMGTLTKAQDSDRVDHDLATMLWELDLPHIHFAITDPLLDEHSWDGKGSMVQQVRDELARAVAHPPTLDLGPPIEPKFGPRATAEYQRLLAEGPATVDEIDALMSAAERDPDILAQFLEVLIEVLSAADGEEEIASAAHAISDVLQSYLDWGEFKALAAAAVQLQAIAADGPPREGVARAILAALATPEALRRAVFELDGAQPERRADLEDLLYLLRDLTYPILVGLLTEAEGKVARKCMLNVCTRGSGVPASYVVPRLADPRWYVVRNMVYLLGALGRENGIPHLERALTHPDARVRREAVRALGATGGERAGELLATCMSDESSDVRILATRSLARTRPEDASTTLLKHLASKEIAGREASEIEAVFEVLAQVADDAAIPDLVDLWSRQSVFRSRPEAVRLGALRVVAEMTSPSAREALSQAARSEDEEISRHARAAIAEARARDQTAPPAS